VSDESVVNEWVHSLMSYHVDLFNLLKDNKVSTWTVGGRLGDFSVSLVYVNNKGVVNPDVTLAGKIGDKVIEATLEILRHETIPFSYVGNSWKFVFVIHVFLAETPKDGSRATEAQLKAVTEATATETVRVEAVAADKIAAQGLAKMKVTSKKGV
jgi:hypothetical protein